MGGLITDYTRDMRSNYWVIELNKRGVYNTDTSSRLEFEFISLYVRLLYCIRRLCFCHCKELPEPGKWEATPTNMYVYDNTM